MSQQDSDKEKVKIPRMAKGKRPHFYDDPAVDQLWAIILALTAELSVTYDRLDTVERLLDQHGVLKRDAVEDYEPDSTAEAERKQRRDEYIARIFRVVREDHGSFAASDSDNEIDKIQSETTG